MRPRYDLPTDPHIKLIKEVGNSLYYLCDGLRFDVEEEGGRTMVSLVNPENGKIIFPLPPVDELKALEGRFTKKMDVEYHLDWKVAVPLICKKS